MQVFASMKASMPEENKDAESIGAGSSDADSASFLLDDNLR